MVNLIHRPRRSSQGGFTLIELMIVIGVMFILAGIALPRFRVSVTRAREAALKEDLYRLRQAIDQYHADTGSYPESLQMLVDKHYVRELEKDPFTGAPDWVEVLEEEPEDSTSSPGVWDVHSASEEIDSTGETTYSEW